MDNFYRDKEKERYLELWASVMEVAIQDLKRKKRMHLYKPGEFKKWREMLGESMDPEYWIFKERFKKGTAPLQSFEGICGLFDVDPKQARKVIKTLIKES